MHNEPVCKTCNLGLLRVPPDDLFGAHSMSEQIACLSRDLQRCEVARQQGEAAEGEARDAHIDTSGPGYGWPLIARLLLNASQAY